MKNENSMSGGLFVLVALVALLGAPLVVGHFTLKSSATVSVHAAVAGAQ